MEALTVKSYWLCREVFMKTYFLHNDCTFDRKGRVRKRVLTILTLVNLKRLK